MMPVAMLILPALFQVVLALIVKVPPVVSHSAPAALT